MKCKSGLEKVFKHKKLLYVVEFNFYYDKNECEADIIRIEGLEDNCNIGEDTIRIAMEVVNAETAMLHQEYLADMADYYAD